MTPRSGSPEANAALVADSFEAFKGGDTERLLAVASPDLVMHFAELPEPLRGRERWQQGFEEDRVAVRVSFHGTHAREFQGIPPTGRGVHYVSHELYRVEDGLIVEEWICSDLAPVFRQPTASS